MNKFKAIPPLLSALFFPLMFSVSFVNLSCDRAGIDCEQYDDDAGAGADAGLFDAANAHDADLTDSAAFVDTGLDDQYFVDVCENVDCSGFGQCQDVSGQAACFCETGYHAEALNCVLDDPCLNLTCGDLAHCETGTCVCDDGLSGNPQVACHEPSSLEVEARQELVDTALAEVGNCEGSVDRPYMDTISRDIGVMILSLGCIAKIPITCRRL